MSQLINEAQSDTKIKVIFIHGGLFYSAGNDLRVFGKMADAERDAIVEEIHYGSYCMV